jgi:hypothetical protein
VTDPHAEPASLLAPLRGRYDDVLARIEELVNIDSGSYTAEGVNRVADRCQARFEAGGWEVERHRHRPDQGWAGAPLGDMVVGRRAGRSPRVGGACCCWPTWTRCSTRGRPPPGRSGSGTGGPTGRG